MTEKWDDRLPTNIEVQWNEFKEQLKKIEEIKIPRSIDHPKAKNYQLHGFGDASEKAFAACVYLRVETENGEIQTRLIAAKTKVAGHVNLPRLELQAAVLVTKLMRVIQQSLELEINELYGWTDSTITLSWIQKEPATWKTFVANRVEAIQEFLPSASWHHIPGIENPADLPSRGITTAELIKSKLWWNGPPRIQDKVIKFEQFDFNPKTEDEQKKFAVCHQIKTEMSWIENFSCLRKLIRTTAYMLRWKNKVKNKEREFPKFLSFTELQEAEIALVKMEQQSFFAKEIKNLKKGNLVNSDSSLKLLNPLYEDGLLKVGGRLEKSEIPIGQKHPVVLPATSHLSKLIVADYHLKFGHANNRVLLATLRQKYWLIRAQNVIRDFIRKCRRCQVYQPHTVSQIMGNLPSTRINPSRAFDQCGIDYAGPVFTLDHKGRGAKTSKKWIAVFVCFATKAVHFELVWGLDTPSFIAALERFIAIRGMPSTMYSDNGTNFQGADNQIRDWYQSFTNSDINQEVPKGLEWKFLPPGSPHLGGLWEAAVKSMKYHLKRVVGDSHLTNEEMTTLLAKISSILNSRPLTTPSMDPSDPGPLTPGHFLIGQPMNALPEPDVTHLKDNTLSRWQRVSQHYQNIWKRWSKEYLHELQKRQKWQKEEPNLEEGQLVLVKEDNLPPLKWQMGKIIKLYPGEDGKVRVIRVKTASCKPELVRKFKKEPQNVPFTTKEFDMTITKICPINMNSPWTS